LYQKMFSKLAIFAALCALAFAGDIKTFEPEPYPCPYHISYPFDLGEPGSPFLVDVDEYGMIDDDNFFVYEIGVQAANNSKKVLEVIVRSDIKYEGELIKVVASYDDDGNYMYSNCTHRGRLDAPAFNYTKEDKADCLNKKESGCKNLTNEETGQWVLINKDRRYVIDPSGLEYTWHDGDDTSMKMFAMDSPCETKTKDVPKSICPSKSKTSSTSTSSAASFTISAAVMALFFIALLF